MATRAFNRPELVIVPKPNQLFQKSIQPSHIDPNEPPTCRDNIHTPSKHVAIAPSFDIRLFGRFNWSQIQERFADRK